MALCWRDVSYPTFMALPHRDRYFLAFNKFRWFLARVAKGLDQTELPPTVKKLMSSHIKFRAWPRVDKASAMHAFFKAHPPPAWVLPWAESVWPQTAPDRGKRLCCKTLLCTWQGSWGIVPIPPEVCVGDINGLVAWLRALPVVTQLWERAREFLDGIREFHHVEAWARALEVCVDSWEQNPAEARLHLHAWLCRETEFRLYGLQGLAFLDSLPHRSAPPGRIRASSGYAGAYYLQAPKVGQVFSEGNKRPFKDYNVPAKWVFQLCVAQKMIGETARAELVQTGENLVRLLPDLDRFLSERLRLGLNRHIEHVQMELAKTLRPSKDIPAVSAWIQKYSRGYWMRKQFLVLDGASGLGKTAFVRSFFGGKATLELNCSDVQHVNLRDFEPLEHRAILWDEAPVKLILGQRKLFQCPPAWVDLGASATANYVYKVWVNDALMVICSNKWASQLAHLPTADHNWVAANQVYVHVTEPLWEAEAAAEAPAQ